MHFTTTTSNSRRHRLLNVGSSIIAGLWLAIFSTDNDSTKQKGARIGPFVTNMFTYPAPIAYLVVLLALISWPLAAGAEDACTMTKLPQSGVYRHTQMKGVVTAHYPNPLELPRNYTGCIQIWIETDGRSQVFTVGHFENGEVRTLRIPAMKLECSYENNKLSKGSGPNEHKCPPSTKGMELATWQK